MVTKLTLTQSNLMMGSVLAKIHMVTKQWWQSCDTGEGSVLAKIHMVTKLMNRLKA